MKILAKEIEKKVAEVDGDGIDSKASHGQILEEAQLANIEKAHFHQTIHYDIQH
jgi:hypothetical protein